MKLVKNGDSGRRVAAPIGRELGTPWGELTEYGAEEFGRVYDYRPLDVQAIDAMLASNGKARALEDAMTLPIRSAQWEIEPGKDDRGQAEWVSEVLTRPANAGGMTTPMSLVVAQATSGILYSKAFFEKVFKLDGAGRVVLDKLALRPVSTCQMARDPRHGSFRGFRQWPYHPGATVPARVAADWVHIPAPRSWVYVHGQHRDPMHGVSDLLVPLWAHEMKKKAVWLWLLFLENTAIPRALIQDNDETRADETARNFVELRGGGALAARETTQVTPWESNGRGSAEFRELMRWLDSEAMASVLAGFLNLPDEGHGSYALSKDQSDFFVKSRQAVAREIADSFTSYVIADLVKYNFGAGASVPRFKFTSLVDVDVDQALTLLSGLVAAQSSPLPDEYVYELAELVAGYLDMPTDKLRKAMDAEGKRRREQAEQMAKTQLQAAQAGQVGQVSGAVSVAAAAAKRGVTRGDSAGRGTGAGRAASAAR